MLTLAINIELQIEMTQSVHTLCIDIVHTLSIMSFLVEWYGIVCETI